MNSFNRELLVDVCRRLSDSPWARATKHTANPEYLEDYKVVCAFMEGVRKAIETNIGSSHNINTLSLGDIIVFGKSIRTNENAEKSGNINSVIKLGNVGEAIANEGLQGFSDIDLNEDPQMKENVKFIQALAKKKLEEERIVTRFDKYEMYHLVLMFLTYCIIVTREHALNGDNPETFELDIGRYMSFRYGILENGEYRIVLRPLEALKKRVKSDGFTE